MSCFSNADSPPMSRAQQVAMQIVCAYLEAHLSPGTPTALVATMTSSDRDALGIEGDQVGTLTKMLEELADCGVLQRAGEGFVPAATNYAGRSLRQTVLRLVEAAIVWRRRAVRLGDVWEFARIEATKLLDETGLSRKSLGESMASLIATGDLITVKTVRGETAEGRNLVLPSRLRDRAAEYLPTEPMTWLEYVAEEIHSLCEERRAHRGPVTFTTRDVRDRLRNHRDGAFPVAHVRYKQDVGAPMTVELALQKLSKTSSPLIASLPGRSAVWVLASALDQVQAQSASYGTDADRIVVAVQRAMDRNGAPVVTARDVAAEIEMDPMLALSGARAVANALSDLAKVTVAVGGQTRRARRDQRVHRIGRIGGAAAYCAPQGDVEGCLRKAHAFVAGGDIVNRIAELRIPLRAAALSDVTLQPLVIGRAKLIVSDVDSALSEIAELQGEDARSLSAQLTASREQVASLARMKALHLELPREVDTSTIGLTAEELRELYAPLNASVAEMPLTKVIARYSRCVARIRNEQYVSRFAQDAANACEFFFDRTDALFYAARTWAGPQARLAGMIAQTEMGELRDRRYALAALSSDRPGDRLRAITCLGFLGPSNFDVLVNRARNDDSPMVREMALWAAGFTGVSDATALVTEVFKSDPAPRVRMTARRYSMLGATWWWRA